MARRWPILSQLLYIVEQISIREAPPMLQIPRMMHLDPKQHAPRVRLGLIAGGVANDFACRRWPVTSCFPVRVGKPRSRASWGSTKALGGGGRGAGESRLRDQGWLRREGLGRARRDWRLVLVGQTGAVDAADAAPGGRIKSFDQPVGDFGWELLPKDRAMTLRHLASMTSGYARPEKPGQAWAYNDYAIQLYQKTLFDKIFQGEPKVVFHDPNRFGPLGLEDGFGFASRIGG